MIIRNLRFMNEKQTILLVDDSENDLFLMRAAFKKAKCNNPLQEVHNGEEAIAYLKGEGPYVTGTNFRCRQSCCWT